MPHTVLNALARTALQAGRDASAVLMEHFARVSHLNVETKADATPVSDADLASHHTLAAILERTGIPVISEESSLRDASLKTYWLIDPLDGTEEFLRGDTDFCVLIALIHKAQPVLGVISHPAKGLHWAGDGWKNAVFQFRMAGGPVASFDHTARRSLNRILVSKTRPDAVVDRLIAAHPEWRPVTRGSALKCVDLITGEADLYPRNARLSTWDLAAGDALLRITGGGIFDAASRQPVRYDDPSFRLPHFVAAPSQELLHLYLDRATGGFS